MTAVRSFLACLLAAGISACAMIDTPPTPQSKTLAEFREIDPKAFASGAFNRELQYQYVKMSVLFGGVSSALPGGYSRDQVIAFDVWTPDQSQMITAVASKQLARGIFALSNSQPINLYGRVVPMLRRTLIGRTDEVLILEVWEINRR